ncbi:type II secretion system protein GspL [Allosphingosinicella vermicomposti]|uniref:type II secretion system protein GspL n=1 Tax=Allosphingosinicella vermicomposti TaxID=614671 RepID=UPI000D0EF3D2|nr:type II secretion system protein GspL [Allosphingosinicella vermicomposti]
MSAGILLFFMGDDGPERWLRIANDAVVARGEGLEGLPPLSDAQGEKSIVAAVLPGDAVSLHWAELPLGLSEPQAQAAARMIAAELGAQSVDELHVAVGPEQDGVRCVALTSNLLVAQVIGRLADAGYDPDLIVPAPLLLTAPDAGLLRYDGLKLPLIRGRSEAYSVEPELAALVTGGVAMTPMDEAALEAGLPAALAALPVNLRQGPFAKRRRWKIDWKRARRIAMLAAAILLVTGAIQIAAIIKTSLATDRAEQEARALAQTVAPGASPATLDARLAALGGGGAFSPLAAHLFDAIRAVPNVQVTAIAYERGGLRATVNADAAGSIAAVQQRLNSLSRAEAGPMRMEGGRSITEITMRAR